MIDQMIQCGTIRQMNEIVIDAPEFPNPSIVAFSKVYADEHGLLVRYLVNDGCAIIYFPSCAIFKFGMPNDEAISSHPLYENGLKFYSAQKVENSSWIRCLAKQNSVHDNHDENKFIDGLVHYIFTFQDSVLECISATILDIPVLEIVNRENSQNMWDMYMKKMDC